MRIFGIDQAVGFSFLNRIWPVFSFPVSLYLITTVFTKETQGYYYTYSSLMLLQTVLDMGFGVVLVQFVSHEWAHLRFGELGEIEGDPKHISRMAALLRMGWRWYLIASGIFIIVTSAGGLLFLQQYTNDLQIVASWLSLCFTATLSFPLLFFRGVLEGSDRIARSQAISVGASVVSTFGGWIAMILGANLYTLAVVNGIYLIVSAGLLVPVIRPYWNVLKAKGGKGVSWRYDFWPQQWRIGVSWICGVIMYQTFVPFIFSLHGPTEAGRIGLAFAMYHAVFALSQSWGYAVGPKMGMLWARSDVPGIVNLARVTIKRSLVASVLGSAASIGVVLAIRYLGFRQGERFPDLLSIVLILSACIALQPAAIKTQVIRFRKIEPFMKMAVGIAVMMLASNYWMGKYFGVLGCSIGFFVIMTFIQVPLVHAIYKKYLPVSSVRS